ncbi:MAG: hypothetical protein FWG10_12990 [Eubacteriaceae bacterium]|nr:hypothetical protein [Eubacteriaceae bacterium]
MIKNGSHLPIPDEPLAKLKKNLDMSPSMPNKETVEELQLNKAIDSIQGNQRKVWLQLRKPL